MSILKILKYPHPILNKKLSLVEHFNSDLKYIIRDMFETMYTYKGIGLAANQVGIDAAVVVIDISKIVENVLPLALINPKITNYGVQKDIAEEGCLSFPGFYEKVKRSKVVEVSYYDINGRKQNITAEGLLARVLQHEIDHINGIQFIQRLPFSKQIKFYTFYALGKYKF